MAEKALVGCGCGVFAYDQSNKGWKAADSGRSQISIYENPSTFMRRIVAIDLQTHQPVINSNLYAEMQYQSVTNVFHQFADRRQAYGLNFVNETEAASFAAQVQKCIESIQKPLSGMPSVGETPPQKQDDHKAKQDDEKKKTGGGEKEAGRRTKARRGRKKEARGRTKEAGRRQTETGEGKKEVRKKPENKEGQKERQEGQRQGRLA